MIAKEVTSYYLDDDDRELMQSLRNDGIHLNDIAEKFDVSHFTVRYQTFPAPLLAGTVTMPVFVIAHAKKAFDKAVPICHNRAMMGMMLPLGDHGDIKSMMFSELRGHVSDLRDMKDGEKVVITKKGEPYCVFERMCWSYYEKKTGLTKG